MALTERQLKAKALAYAINGMAGATVLSPLPLDEKSKLRIQVLQEHEKEVFAKLGEWGWNPMHVGSFPRVCSDGMKAANAYEIDLPSYRQPIADRTIRGEIAGKEAIQAEVAATLKALGIRER
jgi:hypothetical protein